MPKYVTEKLRLGLWKGLCGETSVAEGVGKQGRLEKSGRPDSGPTVTWVTVTFSLSGRESPWMVLSKGVNKDHCGYDHDLSRRQPLKGLSHPGTPSICIVKQTNKQTRQQVQNGVAYAKPHITKPRLNYSFGFPRYGLLHQSIMNHLLSTSLVVFLTNFRHPLKGSNLAITNLGFSA